MKLFGLGSDKQFISLDWDPHSLRVVQWRVSGGQAHALKSLTAPISDEVSVKDAASMGEFVSRTLSQARIRTQAVIVDIPRDQAVLNTMSLPAVDVNNLAGMVQLQIAKELPFPLDDAVVDFAVTEQDHEGQTADVLVAAVRCEVLDFCRAVCERAGLKLERVGLRPYANMVATNEMLGAEESGRAMFVDVGPALTEIGILREGVLVFSRAASVSLDEAAIAVPEAIPPPVTPPDDEFVIESPALDDMLPAKSHDDLVMDSLMVEITRSAEAYRSTDPGAKFDHVVVGGSSGFEGPLAKRISKRFGVPAKTYDPSSVLDLKHHQGAHVEALAATVGLGIGHAAEGKLHFDFLNPKRPLDAAARRRRQLPVVGATAGAVLVIGLLAYFIGIYPVKRAIAELKEEIELKDEMLASYQKVSRIVRQTDQWQDEQSIWPDELKLLFEKFPDNQQAYLEDLDFNARDGEISFRILAKDRKVVDDLQAALADLVRPGLKKGELLPVFNVETNQVTNRGTDPEYPTSTKMFVVSARVEALQEKNKKGKKR